MSEFPTSLYLSSQVQALDKATIASQGVPGFELMYRAGQAAFELLRVRWPGVTKITVFCGVGNNGGDGYVVAGLASKAGMRVNLYSLVDPKLLSSDARAAYEQAKRRGAKSKEFRPGQDKIEGVVVDALIGIGINGDVREHYALTINAINNSGLPVLAIDVPSGICADTGRILGAAVIASATITYIALKQGLMTGAARSHTGELIYESLGASKEDFATQQPSCMRLNFSPPVLRPRSGNSHKGSFGRVLVIAGDVGYGGAGMMAAESALLSGAGIVNLATRNEHVAPALARRPELVVNGISNAREVEALLAHATVLVVGPGLGRSSWSLEMINSCVRSKLPIVLDADGLNFLAQEFNDQPQPNWVLTPHPGEAARLLQTSTGRVQSDRFAAAKSLQEKYGGVIVLKGAGTIVASEEEIRLCSDGGPNMSTAGMGDVLSGIIGGLLAQGLSGADAAELAVWGHANAADAASMKLGRHLMASEIYDDLRKLF